MKQRIDRLTLLHERQAADQLEPKEMEELREKNESLLMRLHETLKQCQDLKTEKGQMDRKINQLSEENGDLTFRLREFARTLTELQEAMDDVSEEHNTALREWEERRSRLETELHSALKEKVEILQGKISLLEDQLAKLKESSSLSEKGEVMSDVLKLEDLNQQVTSLSGKQAELQATVLRLEEEKHFLEASLQSERRSFETEKLQLTGLLTDLQNSASEISRAKEKLEQDSQAQEAHLVAQVKTLTEEIANLMGCLRQKDEELLALHQQVEEERIQRGQLAEDMQKNEQASQAALQELNLRVDHLNNSLKESCEKVAQVEAASQEEYNKAAQEKELALRQLQQKETELSSLAKQLQSLEQARNTSVAETQREKTELSQKIQELEAKILALTAQCQQNEAQAGVVPALKSQLREAQQKLVDKEKLAKENTRLQERLLILEESVRNTEGILEDEKRRAGESLEGNLRRISELEEQIQELNTYRDQAVQEKEEEKAKRQALEGQVQQLGEESRTKVQELQRQLAELSSAAREETGECGRLEEKVQTLSRDREQLQQKFQAEQEKVSELENQVSHLNTKHQEALDELQSRLSHALSQAKVREGAEEKLRAEIGSLLEEMAAVRQEAVQSVAKAKKDRREAAQALEAATRDLAEEKLKRAELEAKAKQLGEQSQKDLNTAESSLSSVRSSLKEKEHEVKQLSSQVKSLEVKLEEVTQQQKQELALRDEEVKRLAGEEEKAKAELATEKASKAALEVQLQNLTNEYRVEVTGLQEEVVRAQEVASEKERELEELRLKNVSRSEELRDLQKTVSKLKGELASEVEALKQEVVQHKQRASELEKVLEASKASQEKLKKDLLDQGEELARSREAVSRAEKELASLRASAQEKGKSEENWKEQMSRCLQDGERKASLISSLEQEMSIMHRQLLEKEAESKDLRRLVMAESEKSKKLEERLRLLQSEMATAASRAAERCSTMKAEAQNSQEQAEKMRVSVEALRKELGVLSKREEDLCKELKAWQEKVFQKDQLLSARQQELASAQALIGELMPIKCLYQQLQVEQASQESKYREEAEQMQKTTSILQAELARTKLELTEQLSAQERFLQQERTVQQLQLEKSSYAEQLATLQRAHAQLVEENRALSERSSHRLQRLDAELAEAKQKYSQELEAAKLDSAKVVAVSKREAEEAQKKLETMTAKYEEAKQKLLTQVEQLEVYQKEQAKQVDELKQKLAQQEKAAQAQQQKAQMREEELQAMVKQANEKADELQGQLAQKEKATEHYKAQIEKAKTHYNAKKQENQELLKKLKGLEQLEKENAELKSESERLVRELQHTAMQAKESELSCKNLTSRVRVLEAQSPQLSCSPDTFGQEAGGGNRPPDPVEVLPLVDQMKQAGMTWFEVEFADRQLREQGKFQVATDALKSRETFRQSPADISTDSLDLSPSEETRPLNSTSRRTRRSLSESGAVESSKVSQPLPRKMESLESLYFTPIPTRSRSKLENSGGSTGDVSFESGRKTLSSRRRTTQVISITMTKVMWGLPWVGAEAWWQHLRAARKRDEVEAPSSANESFFSVQSAGSQATSQETVKTRLRSAASSSIHSLSSLPSQESLHRLSASSPNDRASNTALMSLPGYRPATRSSLRHSQAGGANAGRRSSSFYVGTCHDEPEQLDEWNRIAELQQRNRVCPPHLKTCYPLESRPSQSLTTITDEEMMTGDPKETLRRATMLPSQVAEGPVTRRSTLSSTWAAGDGVATRQQRKRISDESQHGPGTPESKKSASCFPRPQTPKGRTEDHKHSSHPGGKKGKGQAADKQSERRQSLAFSILNTPKKLGNSLLRRGANRKVTPKSSPRSGSRRSPRTSASPKGKGAKARERDNGGTAEPRHKSPVCGFSSSRFWPQQPSTQDWKPSVALQEG
ncbi:hypothetical protein JD844_033866 [Phrynosoma platyrhinos]|uniref:Nuclear mitotic apparatus protein 1 n=1 Tax=Phrynosoma platyrhinos TaxID=52577 RepID=A0ABQ7T740_PHRPL|nr:hypothetical protein JD844_033866 [Phrynosoma platyrhinos]